ncbi:MAG: hypothetical protein R2932_28625 [Caldilineaceae bacterium]
MKQIFAVVVAAPILALFAGIGVLAFRIADKWDERNTDVLISNITMACGIGGIVLALLLAAFVGLVFYGRWQRDKHWDDPPLLRYNQPRRLPVTMQQPAWLDMPPGLPDLQETKGRLHSAGPNAYEDLDQSLFGDSDAIDSEWSRLS